MENCPLCLSTQIEEFSHANDKLYFKCETCHLIFLDKKFFLPRDEEKLRYESHNNDPSDQRYILHLSKLTDKLIPFLKPGSTGLDYGSGSGKPISFILGKAGYDVSDYDPFFYDYRELLTRKYDSITCTETAEHFHDPAKEFTLFNSMLNPEGILAIMTNFYSGENDFDSWWYPRDPTHVCFYSIDTFRWLSGKLKWEILLLDETDNVIIFRKSA